MLRQGGHFADAFDAAGGNAVISGGGWGRGRGRGRGAGRGATVAAVGAVTTAKPVKADAVTQQPSIAAGARDGDTCCFACPAILHV